MTVNNKREVFLTVDQIRKIAAFCTPIAQAAIWAALLTGARRGELLQIQREHIGRDSITFPASNTKTLRMRVVPIIPALRPWLKYFRLDMTLYGVQSSWRRAREDWHASREFSRPAPFLREHHAGPRRGPLHHQQNSRGMPMCKQHIATLTCRWMLSAWRWTSCPLWWWQSKLHPKITPIKKAAYR